jgi:hypothetical protein
MTKPTMTEAENVVMDAEKEALNLLLEATETYNAALVSIGAGLPSKLTLDAGRILWEIRNTLDYRRLTELPAAILKYKPLPSPDGDTPTS